MCVRFDKTVSFSGIFSSSSMAIITSMLYRWVTFIFLLGCSRGIGLLTAPFDFFGFATFSGLATKPGVGISSTFVVIEQHGSSSSFLFSFSFSDDVSLSYFKIVSIGGISPDVSDVGTGTSSSDVPSFNAASLGVSLTSTTFFFFLSATSFEGLMAFATSLLASLLAFFSPCGRKVLLCSVSLSTLPLFLEKNWFQFAASSSPPHQNGSVNVFFKVRGCRGGSAVLF